MKYVSHNGKLEMPKVIAGCMRLKDSGVSGGELREFVEGCVELGVNAFDHAPVYGGYTCEEIFGKHVLAGNTGLRSKIKLITKTGIVLPGTRENQNIYYHSAASEIIAEVEQSLHKLHTDYVDLLLIHRHDPLGCPEDTAAALERLIRDGKILHAGVSNYTPMQAAALQKYLAVPLLTNQIELSALNTEHFFDGQIEDSWIQNRSLMAWSPLGGGTIFTGGDEKTVRLRTCLTGLSEKYGKDIDVLLYAWLFSHPAPIMAVSGTIRLSRIHAAAEALEVGLDRDDWYGILAASRGYPVP